MNDRAYDLVARGYRERRAELPAQAADYFAEAAARSRAAGDDAGLAKALTGLGQVERDLGNIDAASRCYDEALTIVRTLCDEQWLAHTVRHVADILRERGLFAAAELKYEEALAIYRGDASTTSLDLANTARGYALLHEHLGNDSAARALWREAKELYASAGVRDGVDESERRLH